MGWKMKFRGETTRQIPFTHVRAHTMRARQSLEGERERERERKRWTGGEHTHPRSYVLTPPLGANLQGK